MSTTTITSENDENVFVITGGTSGMGKFVAMKLAEYYGTTAPHKKARTITHIIIIGRDSKKGQSAIADIREQCGGICYNNINARNNKNGYHSNGNSNNSSNSDNNVNIIYMQADLSLISEIRSVSVQIRKLVSHVDILLHAAGNIFTMKRKVTSEGLELNFAIQYMARYALTEELLGLLYAATTITTARTKKRARVLSLMGGGANYGTFQESMDFHNLQGEKKYRFVSTIKMTSLACDLLTCAQIQRYPNIAFYNYGPGLVKSGLLMKNALLGVFVKALGCIIARDPMDAAEDMMELLVVPENRVSCIYESGFYGLSLRRNCCRYSPDSPDATQIWNYGETIMKNLTLH
mmetsp:Transcript_43736/g.51217  ORF Transcript_43736/g.51217 Transcript_43736/m.51217 type:complete len:349 (+) Transcript_43736:168-1214(+)